MKKLLSAFELYFCKREKDLLFIFFEPRDRFFDDIASNADNLLEERTTVVFVLLSLFSFVLSFSFLYMCVCVRSRYDTRTHGVVLNINI